jgi:putative ABC transport system ATP-binding protein
MLRDGGDCSVFDHDYNRMSLKETTIFRGRNIGFVFQTFNLIPALTAAENAATPRLIAGTNRRAAVDQACSLLREMGFDDRMMRSLPCDLSGGQQQRVAIARAIVHNPRLVVCDEPTSALDRESGHLVMRLLRRFALAKDRVLLVVTHDPRIFEFADRIARMEDGRITGIAQPPSSPSQPQN